MPDATAADISALQTWKGWLFIILTSLLLSLLVHRSATDSDKDMRKSDTLAAKPMPAAEFRDLLQRQQQSRDSGCDPPLMYTAPIAATTGTKP